MATKHWAPGELDRLQLQIAEDGDGDEVCDCCGRTISAHDPAAPACSDSRRVAAIGQALAKRRDPLLVMADQRISASKAAHLYYRGTRLQVMRRTLDYLAQREMDIALLAAHLDLMQRWAA